MWLEKGIGWRNSLKHFRQELTLAHLSVGLTSFILAASAPLVVLLAAANQAHLPLELTISWICINYLTSGVAMVLLSLYYRQPLIMAWSIPGAALSGEVLAHHPFSEVQGAYIVTTLIMLSLGLSGTMRKILALIPRQVLMAMICGVLLPYGLAIFSSLNTIPFLTLPSLGTYLVLQFTFPKLGKLIPPMLAAVVVALVLATLTGTTNWSALDLKTAKVVFSLPSFSLATIVELAIPLAITALSFGDGQAYSILVGQGYNPPINAMTSSSGVVSLVNALFGGHTGCMGGILQGIVADPQAGE